MNSPSPGLQDAGTPSPLSRSPGLDKTEGHQTTICCLAWHLTHKNLSPYTSSLQDTRRLQRRKVESAGRIEAVNKLALAGGRIVWLKDQALVEVHHEDRTFLPLGAMTQVTKEMELE